MTNQKKLGFLLSIVLLASAIGCATPASAPLTTPTPAAPKVTPAAPKVITWRLQSLYPPASFTDQGYVVPWIKAIESATGGRLKIQSYPPGAIASAGEMFDSLKAGVYEVAVHYAGYYSKLIPEVDVAMLPFANVAPWQMYELYYQRGFSDIINEAYAAHNMVNFLWTCDDFYSIGVRSSIKSFDELKGLKIRAVGVYGELAKELGASPTVIAPAELFMALKMGTIDGVVYGGEGLEDYKFYEVLKTWFVPGFGGVTFDLLFNKQAFEALPKDIQETIRILTPAINLESSAKDRIYVENNFAIARQKGMELVQMSDKDMAKARKTALTLWDKVATQSPRSAKLVEILKKQHKDRGWIE